MELEIHTNFRKQNKATNVVGIFSWVVFAGKTAIFLSTDFKSIFLLDVNIPSPFNVSKELDEKIYFSEEENSCHIKRFILRMKKYVVII